MYLREPRWEEVARSVNAAAEPLPLTFLHQIEVTNAVHRAEFLKAVDPKQRAAVLETFERDQGDGLYRRYAVDLPKITKSALEISGSWTAKLGVRSLDVLHVAAARYLGAKTFLTGDDRQRAVAAAIGFSVQDEPTEVQP